MMLLSSHRAWMAPPTRLFLAPAFIVTVLSATEPASAQNGVPPTVLWSSCRDATPTTLAALAEKAKPVLWFSRDEPLLDLGKPLPAEWPRPPQRSTTSDVVYYRIRTLKALTTDNLLVAALQKKVLAGAARVITPAGAHPEAIANVKLDREILTHLHELIVRYMFYYSNELGTGRHVHDLEAVEIRLRVELADERGDPDAPERKCQQVRAVTVYGAAHGLGLYTNVLDLDDVSKDRISDIETVEQAARSSPPPPPAEGLVLPSAQVIRTDPFWPLVILVEEGKHASAPDRNGDGMFTPTYDVNKYSADAWGARDTMRSKHLAPAFRADTFKQRIPEIVSDGRKPRPADASSTWSQEAFKRHVRYDYELRRTTTDAEVCGEPAVTRSEPERQETMRAYARALRGGEKKDPYPLLANQRFCNDTSMQTRHNMSDFFEHLGVGGQYNGFTRIPERFSGSVRFDGGPGWTGTVPVPLSVPMLGGVVVVRISGHWPTTRARNSLDALYMPSASRFADWYVGVGGDFGRYAADADTRRGAELAGQQDVEQGWRSAAELGAKFRFPIPGAGTFFGSRVAVRANTQEGLHNARLVFEVGAGIW